jgi:spore maturation protein SpmA
VLNAIWLGMILISVVLAAFTGRMEAVSKAAVESAKDAVTVVIGLIGLMVFFLGLMRVASDGGLLHWIARGIAPLMRRLFPEVPADHPAMHAMIMNLASNMLGLGNAATPFGLKAMVELDRLNAFPGVATNAMALFLAINTTSVTLLPTGVASVRAALGSTSPFSIFFPTLIATTCSTGVAVILALLLSRLRRYQARPLPDAPSTSPLESPALPELPDLGSGPPSTPRSPGERIVLWGFGLAMLAALGLHVSGGLATAAASTVLFGVLEDWLLPLLIAGLLLVGFAGRVRVYEALVAGGREGLEVAARIVPFLVAILVAVGMFRASGALEVLIRVLEPLTSLIGMPGEALPMALLRPLSGSGAYGVMTEIMKTHGPDSFVGNLVSTIQGSTETTFYVLAVYFGAARIRDGRHTLPTCLIGELAGVLGAVAACHLFFG